MDAAALIRRTRSTSGLSLRALAERAGTSYSTLSAYEHGHKTPRLETLERILNCAGASLTTNLEVGIERRNGLDRGDELLLVLDLAEALPRRPASPELDAPRFGDRREARPLPGGRS